MNKLYILAILGSLFCISCQPEVNAPDPVIPTDSCRIQTSYYYGGSGGINDSANHTYAAGKLVKVTSNEYEVVYKYNGNLVSSMEYTDLFLNRLYMVDSFDYTNSVLTRIRRHDYDQFWQTDTVHSVFNLNYSNSKLTEIVRIDEWQGFPDIDTTWWQFNYTGDNVTKLYWYDNFGGEDSVMYSYNTDLNYFANVGKYFFQHDPFFQIHVGFEPHIPYFISKNNVNSFTIYQNVNYPVTYEVDSTNRPTLVRQGGFDYMGYKYECP